MYAPRTNKFPPRIPNHSSLRRKPVAGNFAADDRRVTIIGWKLQTIVAKPGVSDKTAKRPPVVVRRRRFRGRAFERSLKSWAAGGSLRGRGVGRNGVVETIARMKFARLKTRAEMRVLLPGSQIWFSSPV